MTPKVGTSRVCVKASARDTFTQIRTVFLLGWWVPLTGSALMKMVFDESGHLCGPPVLSTFDPEGDTFRYVRDNLTDAQLEASDGSGALMIVKTIRLPVGPSQLRKQFGCCWTSSDSILFDKNMVKS